MRNRCCYWAFLPTRSLGENAAPADLAEGEELGSNLLRVPQSSLWGPSGHLGQIRGIFALVCPRAASGHATAPPSTPRNARRFMSNPRLRRRHRVVMTKTSTLVGGWNGPRVFRLQPDLRSMPPMNVSGEPTVLTRLAHFPSPCRRHSRRRAVVHQETASECG